MKHKESSGGEKMAPSDIKAMTTRWMKLLRGPFVIGTMALSLFGEIFTFCAFGQEMGGLRGQVTDPSGAAVPAAHVSLRTPDGTAVTSETGEIGRYLFAKLPAGAYTIRISASGFAPYVSPTLDIQADSSSTFDVRLRLGSSQQEITVVDADQVDVDPSQNASATVLQGRALDMLSDDPEDLHKDLMALAGPMAGPDGGQIYVDGFSNGQLPTKGSIREVRVNSNPFSAEFDKIGYGKIEILTKPGTDKLHGSELVQFDSSSLDARNPFGTTKPSYLSQQYDGDVSGPINAKTSLFLDYTYRHQDDQALVNATILNASLVPTRLIQTAPMPNTRLSISPRVDYQISPNVTLQARFAHARIANDGVGIGQFSLPITGTTSRIHNYSVQATATWLVSHMTVNETRFQSTRSDTTGSGMNSAPVINVAGAFTGGAATMGSSFNNQDAYELQNYTTTTRGAHLIRFGVRLRGTLEDTGTNQNFNGTFYFSSLDNYAATLAGISQGLSWAETVAHGGGAFQYAITTGTPFASVGQVDFAPFFQDDWRLHPNVTLSMGLRYEIQNEISDRTDFSPRVGIAWGLGKRPGTQTPRYVLRAGFGTFFDRFGIAQALNAERLNGINQRHYVIANPNFSWADTPGILPAVARQPVTTYGVDANLVSPRAYESMIALERQWPRNITTAITYVVARGVHELRTRNINAPLPGTYVFGNPTSGVYPLGKRDPLDLYESSGVFKQTQVVANLNLRLNAKFNLFGYYMWARASTNTDGVNTFAASSYDTSNEWGRSLYEARNRILFGGSVDLPLAIRLAPSITYYSPMPYNVLIGQDLNGDGQNNDRPAYATKADNPAYVVQTSYGALNLRPLPGEAIIPRNLGNGFDTFTMNLRTSRTWAFGEATKGAGRNHYSLTLSVEARNLTNRVNAGPPVGVLTSPLFGQPQGLSTVGNGSLAQSSNRRWQMQARFAF